MYAGVKDYYKGRTHDASAADRETQACEEIARFLTGAFLFFRFFFPALDTNYWKFLVSFEIFINFGFLFSPTRPSSAHCSPAVDGPHTADRRERSLAGRRGRRAPAVHSVLGENRSVRRRRRRLPGTAAVAAVDGRQEVRASVPRLRIAAAGKAHVVDGRPATGHHPRDGKRTKLEVVSMKSRSISIVFCDNSR